MQHVQNYLKNLYNQMKEENDGSVTITQGQEERDYEDSQLHQ